MHGPFEVRHLFIFLVEAFNFIDTYGLAPMDLLGIKGQCIAWIALSDV